MSVGGQEEQGPWSSRERARGLALGKLSQGVGLPREDGEVGQREEGRKDSLLLTPPTPRERLPGVQVHWPGRGFCSSDGSVGRREREMGWP